MATTRSQDTDTLFNTAPQLRAQLVQLQTTLSLQMNKPAFLLQPLGSALRQKTTQKKLVTKIHRHFHKQLLESLTTSPVDSAVLHSQAASHTGPHLMQPSSKADEADDRCFRVAAARRLMLPTPQIWFGPALTKAQRAKSVPNQWMYSSTTAMVVGTAAVSTAGMLQWPGAQQTSYTHTVAPRCRSNRREHARMDLVF